MSLPTASKHNGRDQIIHCSKWLLGREARKDISRCESIQPISTLKQTYHTTLDKCFSKHEKEKKRAYEQRYEQRK